MAVTISYLSEEIIHTILKTDNISIKDVLNFSCTSTRYRDMIETCNSLWRWKFYQKWPRMKSICDETMQKGPLDFKELIKARVKCKKHLRCFLKQMNRMHHYNTHQDGRFTSAYVTSHEDNINIDERCINSLIHPDRTTHPLNYHLLLDETTLLCQRAKGKPTEDLTNIYYAQKLIPYLKHYNLRNVWQEFINRPAEQQLSEEAATFVAQWYQPEENISYTIVKAYLDNIAQYVITDLKVQNPQHPIFTTSSEQLSFWKDNNIDDNQWSNTDGRQILDIVCKVFSKLQFHGVAYEENKVFSQEYILINHVLRKKIGYVIPLAIIFQSVARRLGIRCDVISFPGHCFITWKSEYNVTESEHQCFYIDVLNWAILTKNACPRIRGAVKCPLNFKTHGSINSVELILKLLNRMQLTTDRNISYKHIQTRWTLDLQQLVKPEDIDVITQLKYYYETRHMSLSSLITAVEKLHINDAFEETTRAGLLLNDLRKSEEMISMWNKLQTYTRSPKRKYPGMKFAVGMIVLVGKDVNLMGVIIAREQVDPAMNLEKVPPLWHYAIYCIDEKVYGATEDGIYRIATDSLRKTRCIESRELGRYFFEFKGTYYKLNEVLEEEYPDDALYLANLYNF